MKDAENQMHNGSCIIPFLVSLIQKINEIFIYRYPAS